VSDLAERLDSGLAVAWRPDKEDADTLIGEVVSVDLGTSDYGTYPLIVVRSDDGTEKAFHASHTVARNELKRARPQVGQRIGIKYLGKQTAAEGSKYGSYIGYRVEMERAAGTEFNWDKVDAEPDPQPAFQTSEPATVNVPEGAGDDDVPF